MWKRPEAADFREVVASAESKLIMCSPFVTRYGLNVVGSALQGGLKEVEVWTRLKLRDWVTGAGEPDALLDFLDSLPSGTHSHLFSSDLLHAKFFIADDKKGIAGSANLTRGGLGGNIEVGAVVVAPEVNELLAYAQDTRGLLTPTTRKELSDFVTRAQRLAPEREALIDLIQGAAAPIPGRRPLIRLTEFVKYCQGFSGEAPDNIHAIYRNEDSSNRSGHLKQAFYAVQRFFQEYPNHLTFVAAELAHHPFDLRGTPVEKSWKAFITTFHDETDPDLGYDLSTLVDTYLTPGFGGVSRPGGAGGGRGDYPFKLVWPLVARMMSSQK